MSKFVGGIVGHAIGDAMGVPTEFFKRDELMANPDKLKVILPQTIGQQPSDVQDQLIGVPNIIEHSDMAMMTLADASRVCNREIIDDCNQLICFLSHTSKTLQTAVEYAEETHKVVTIFYLD